MMKIVIEPENNIHAYSENHLKQVKSIVPNVEIVLAKDKNALEKELETAEILVTSPFTWKALNFNEAKNLKWVQSTSAGVTDLANFLKDKDVLLTNSSGVHPIPIAEHVLGMILMFSRRLNRVYRSQITKQQWERGIETLDPFEIADKTLAIVGYGRIGARIAKLAKGFQMKTVALEHHTEIEDQNIDKVYKNLEQVLKEADFVVDCLPLTDDTKGYFNKEIFPKMKKGSYFFNIGRGSTVVEVDLIDALKNKTIAGAGLDVFETEPLPSDSPLWSMDNVIISPHISGWTPKYTDRVIEIFCENLKAYLNKTPMPTLVDKEKGY